MNAANPRPCRCWTETWSLHEGHCCFARTSPEDCHDDHAALLAQAPPTVTHAVVAADEEGALW